MKKIISILTIVSLVFSTNTAVFAKTTQTDGETEKYVELLSEMIQQYDTDDYFATMSVTIGEPNLVIDGIEVPIDESGSVAYVENGRTLMPVRGIAEAIGAEVNYDDATQTVTVENQDTMIAMTIGDNEMEVNGETVMLHTAPQIKEDRTMLPVRDVAEALDCEVEWQQDTQTATFTRDYQTKRVIVNSENADTTDAVESFSADGKTVIQFDNISDAKKCVEINTDSGYIAEPDYIRSIQAMSWGAGDIGGDNYYYQTDYVAGSAIVAVIDTGIDYNHEVFNNRIVGGYDFYHNDNYCEDQRGHGTLVASTVLDIAGKNPNIKVMPLKVFGSEDSCASSAVAAAIKYAADNGADVVNLSLGGQHRSDIEQEAIDYANSRNVAIVAAAGNEQLDLTVNEYSPGGLNGVITVSAITQDNNLASFSNYGEGIVEFGAPGVSVKCAQNGGGYTSAGGTSLASPHVAGVYALAKAVHKDMSTNDITVALQNNAIKIGSSRLFGAGSIRINNLERYLSKMYYSNVEVTNVTQDNAEVIGRIGYTGIIPESIGVEINGKEVFSTTFSDNENDEMNFRCNLKGNAGYNLNSGTTYEAKIFTDQGGYVLVTDPVHFTTGGAPAKPEPTPEPEPTKSELRILPENYPTSAIEQGSKFYLSGRIKSNYHITDVRSYLLDSNKNVLQEASGWTTTKTYVIENSQLDVGLKFGNLNVGKYYLRYYAEDETGNKVTWTSDAFNVVAKEKDPEPILSDLRILPDAYPNGEITVGNKFNLSGRIKSNYHITDVRAYMLDANRNVVMEASGWTTTKTYVIEGSSLDKGMKFNTLSEGGYYLQYKASDESGKTVSWTSGIFYVKGAKNNDPIASDPIISDGTYIIASKLDKNYVLDIDGAGKSDGDNLQLWERNDTPAQSFRVTHLGNGYYLIVNTNSGKAIDAEWGGVEAGTNVWQYEINDTPAQIWKIVSAGNNSYYIINKESGLYLDVDNAYAESGTNIKLFEFNDLYDAQKWCFIKQ